MKLIISESQLKRVINEIGGFDDKDAMGSHSTMIQNNIMVKVVETIKAMKATINLLDTDGIKTENVIYLIEQILDMLDNTSKMLDVFIPEIYLDRDYKEAAIEFNQKNKKLIKKLGMVKHIAIGMSVMEVKDILNETIEDIFHTYINFGEFANRVNMRYVKRMDPDFDPLDN
jgi:hypothetical protein